LGEGGTVGESLNTPVAEEEPLEERLKALQS